MTAALIDKRAFRQALGTFATGVTIITARDAQGRPVGLTANSFNSVSLDPPLVLWSLSLQSKNLPVFRQAANWAVHILAADQEDMSNRFASAGADKFSGLEIHDGLEGAPLIEGCAARFGCEATFEYEGGDHAIFVGKVVDFSMRDVQPLVFHGGQYSRLMPRPGYVRPDEIAAEGEFNRHFIGHILLRAYHAAFEDLRREYHSRGLRSAEYTVIAALGLGDGCTPAELIERASHGGVCLPEQAIEGMIQSGYIAAQQNSLFLTVTGRKILVELVAVAQATQLQFEQRLSAQELDLLHDLLLRLTAKNSR